MMALFYFQVNYIFEILEMFPFGCLILLAHFSKSDKKLGVTVDECSKFKKMNEALMYEMEVSGVV